MFKMLDARWADSCRDSPSLLRPAALLARGGEQFDEFLCGEGVRIGHAHASKIFDRKPRTLINEGIQRLKIMQSTFHLSGSSLAAIAATALTLVSPLVLLAQEAPSPTGAKPALKLQVIEGVEVKLPDRSIFYQRVAPPVPPPARPAPVPVPKPLSPAERAAAEARAKKNFEVLMISATVYDRRVTELRWHVGNHECRAWSNIDFNYIAGHGEIETEDTVYLLIMGIGNDSAEAVEAANQNAAAFGSSWRKELPPAERFSDKRSEYLLADVTKEPPPTEALAPMDAIHIYYDAHRERLAEEYIRREAARTAREQWLKEHPPLPQNTVINFWPKKSRNYPTTGK